VCINYKLFIKIMWIFFYHNIYISINLMKYKFTIAMFFTLFVSFKKNYFQLYLMKKIFYILFAFVLSTLFYACSSCKNKHDGNAEIQDSLKTIYELLPTEQQEVIELVYLWNSLHDTSNIYALDSIYSETVLFYKKKFTKKNIIDTKKYRIKKADKYRQLIIGRIGIYPSDTGDYKCEFLKLVNIDNKPKVYHTYLVFKKINNTWKIIVESDKESDLRPELASLFDRFQESESTSSGDFDGDGEKEDLIVIKPIQDTLGNYSSTTTKVTFTNLSMPEINIENCIGVNVLNENDVDGDGADDFSIVIKKANGEVGNVILYSFKRGAWIKTIQFTAPSEEVFGSRQNLIEFAGNGNVKVRTVEKSSAGSDSLVIKTISTWE
jgi:hypothetical protein